MPVSAHWWQWPTILSLDAAAVTVAWQVGVARDVGVTIGWPQAVVLGCSVWLAYTGDRWIESWRLGEEQVVTARHRFHQQHRWPMFVAMIVGLVVDVAIALRFLNGDDIAAGVVLTATVLVYLVSHQWLHRHATWRVPKELLIATLLTAGVWLFVRDAGLGRLAVPLGLFWLLCFGNCALISRWEANVDRAQGQTSLALQLPRAALWIPVLPWAIAVVAGIAIAATPDTRGFIVWSALLSAVILAGIDRLEPSLGWRRARVAADAALLTPLLWWLL